jgi:hypothetical protein
MKQLNLIDSRFERAGSRLRGMHRKDATISRINLCDFQHGQNVGAYHARISAGIVLWSLSLGPFQTQPRWGCTQCGHVTRILVIKVSLRLWVQESAYITDRNQRRPHVFPSVRSGASCFDDSHLGWPPHPSVEQLGTEVPRSQETAPPPGTII